jgi:hypothetical protein
MRKIHRLVRRVTETLGVPNRSVGPLTVRNNADWLL